MLKKVDKIFIGKYLERNASLVNGADMTTTQSAISDGEIVVLDKDYRVVVGASASYNNTKVIYLAEGSSEIFTTTNPDGTTLTGRRLLLSNAIDGARIVNYTGGKYEAKSEAVATIPAISDTIVAGTQYILQVVYRGDVASEYRGQNLEKHYYKAKSGDTSSDVFDGLVKSVNKRYKKTAIKKSNARLIDAANNAGTLTITARPLPSCTTSVNNIDEFLQNNMSVVLNYVDNDYNWQTVGLSSPKTYTPAERGYGTWELVRDSEKEALPYEGVTNNVWFPVIKPQMRVIKDARYNMINIENDARYRSADNQYNKETSLENLIALQAGSGATSPQGDEILSTLNYWMGSLPMVFSPVSFA